MKHLRILYALVLAPIAVVCTGDSTRAGGIAAQNTPTNISGASNPFNLTVVGHSSPVDLSSQVNAALRCNASSLTATDKQLAAIAHAMLSSDDARASYDAQLKSKSIADRIAAHLVLIRNGLDKRGITVSGS